MTVDTAANPQALLTLARVRWIAVAVLCVAFLTAIYALAVLTSTGQRLENGALAGAYQVDDQVITSADIALSRITLTSLAVATLAVGAIGLLRRKVKLAILAVAVIGMGQVVTQGLKRYILPRPDLVDAPLGYSHNSFPSGHTTIAMTVLVAVILVVPFRLRGIAMLIVMTWAVSIGAYTVTARWHRASDTLGADAIAVALGCVAALALLRWGQVRRAPRQARLPRNFYAVVIGLFGLLSLTLGVLLLGAVDNPGTEQGEWNLFLAAHSFSSGGSIFFGLLYWWTWHELEVG